MHNSDYRNKTTVLHEEKYHHQQSRPSWQLPIHNLTCETYESIWTLGKTPSTENQPDARACT